MTYLRNLWTRIIAWICAEDTRAHDEWAAFRDRLDPRRKK